MTPVLADHKATRLRKFKRRPKSKHTSRRKLNSSAMPLTEADIRLALRDCYDPVLPCNIVDLGMISSIQLEEAPDAPGSSIPGILPKYRVTITLTPATTDEAATAQLTAQIRNCLAGIEQVFHATVTLLDTPAWSPARITPAGRRTLGLDGNPALIQIR